MRIRFAIDQSDPERWNDTCDGNAASASNMYVNQRHIHENCTIWDTFRDTYRKYCRENMNLRTQTVLVDIPDDIMFQFMMQGVHDYDYLVYNLVTEKLVFSADIDEAQSESYTTTNVNSRNLWGTASSSSGADRILDWEVLDFNIPTRESTIYVAEGEMYFDLLEYIKPNIQEWANTKYYHISSELNNVVTILENEYSNKLERSVDYSPSCSPVPDSDYSSSVNISCDGFKFLMLQYIEDGEYFIGAQQNLCSGHIDVLRRIYLDVYRRSTFTPVLK